MPSFKYQTLLGHYLWKLSKEDGHSQRKFALGSVIGMSSAVWHEEQSCSIVVTTYSERTTKRLGNPIKLLKALPSDFRYVKYDGECKPRQILNEKKCEQFLDCLLTPAQQVALQLELELR